MEGYVAWRIEFEKQDHGGERKKADSLSQPEAMQAKYIHVETKYLMSNQPLTSEHEHISKRDHEWRRE